MPLEIGEIIGTSPEDILDRGSLLRRRRRRSARDGLVDEFVGGKIEEGVSDLFNMEMKARQEGRLRQAENRAEITHTVQTVDSLLKLGRSFVKELPPEQQFPAIRKLLDGLPPSHLKNFISDLPKEVFTSPGSEAEAMELAFSNTSPETKRAAFLQSHGLVPGSIKISDRELEGLQKDLKAEVAKVRGDAWYGSMGTGKGKGPKPTRVHQALNMTVEELPLGSITDTHYAIAAKVEAREMSSKLTISEEAISQDILRQFRKQIPRPKAQTSRPVKETPSLERVRNRNVGEFVDGAPGQYAVMTINDLLARFSSEQDLQRKKEMAEVLLRIGDKLIVPEAQ